MPPKNRALLAINQRPPTPGRAAVSVRGAFGGAVPSGGGNSTAAGAYGSEPGSPNSGDLDLYTDSVQIARYDGAEWAPWGPIWALTPPDNADYSWVNQGSATLATSNGVICLATAATGGGVSARVKAIPTAPYTIDILTAVNFLGRQYNGCGVLWRESSTGKLITFGVRAEASYTQIRADRYSNPTTYDSSIAYDYCGYRSLWWWRLQDDATNRTASFSVDGVNWFVYTTGLSGNYITPDQVGMYVTDGGTGPVGITLLSWREY